MVNVSSSVTSGSTTTLVDSLKREFPNVFKSVLGHCTKIKAHLRLKPDPQPVFCRARPVPIGIQPAIDKELDRLLELGAIKKTDYSTWAAPILAVRKKDGSLRICMDFSTGLNAALELDRHPLPRPEDLWNKMQGICIFTQIDLKDAYLQIELDEGSKELVGINTHRGIFQCQRLPFGVKSAPGIFQKLMDQLTSGLGNTAVYLDDIIVASPNVKSHIQSLKSLFSRINSYGLRVRLDKCHFFQTKLKFLGQIVDASGIRPDPARNQALQELPEPHDISTLRSFLGVLNYYARFLKEIRSIRAPLDELLKKDVPWHWDSEQQQAFNKAKAALQTERMLAHYDPAKPIIVSADASQHGIGATIAHQLPDGSEPVIEHASRSLTPAERNYGQIEKEALALVWAVKKFHRMLLGRTFSLRTDHKPLLSIFGSKNGIPIYTASRLQRWALILANYDFNLKYVSTNATGQADMLSRLISEQKSDEERVVAQISVPTAHRGDELISAENHIQLTEAEDSLVELFLADLNQLPVSIKDLLSAQEQDELLCAVKHHITNGWPDKSPSANLSPYYERRLNLSIIQDCLVFRGRSVIPGTLQNAVLKALHLTHPGIVRMKAFARQYVYWPGIDSDIEAMVRLCDDCQSAAKMPAKQPLQPWNPSNKVFERIHLDFACPCSDGNTYLVIIDSYSRWPEISLMSSTSSVATINVLRHLFDRYGLPHVIVSDNGTQFTSGEFREFCSQNGIKQMFSAPYHPQSNGQAERYVDILKRQMKKCNNNVKEWLSNSLRDYRATPHPALGGKTPSELFLGRQIRTKLSLIRPEQQSDTAQRGLEQSDPVSEVHVTRKQYQDNMVSQFNRKHGAKYRKFEVGNQVSFRNYRNGKELWLSGISLKT
jgi:hypothetical protein